MKLNRKGYLTVEIILSSVIAMTIAFFLITLTMKLSNKNNDAYLDTVLVTDKALITKNIKELIEKDIRNNCGINDIECGSGTCTLYFKTPSGNDLEKKLKIEGKQISYGDTSNYDYVKKFNSSLNNASLSYNGSRGDPVAKAPVLDGSILNFRITAKTIYSDYDYGINFSVINDKSGRKSGQIFLYYYYVSLELLPEPAQYNYNICSNSNGSLQLDISVDSDLIYGLETRGLMIENSTIDNISCYSDEYMHNEYNDGISVQDNTIIVFPYNIPLNLYCNVRIK